MPHLTDGQLHAYLDGALGDLEGSAVGDVRSHIEACSDCQARIQRARGVRDDAAELLSAAAPASVAPPPFEEVERRSAARTATASATAAPARRRVAGPQSLAWAASLAVALTAGWLARGTVGEPGRSAGASSDEVVTYQETAEGAGLEQVLRSEGSLASRADLNEVVPEAAGNAAGVRASDDLQRPAEEGKRERVALDQMAVRDSAGDAADEELRANLRSAEMDAADRDKAAELSADEAEMPAAGAETVSEPEAVPERQMAKAAAPAAAVAGRGVVSPEWRTVDRNVAEELLGGELRTLENLPVISVRVRSSAAAPEVWTSQRLSSGHTLDLVQIPADAGAPISEGGYESTQKLRWVDRIWIDGFVIEARAPLPPDSLRVLLNNLKNR